MRNLRNNVVFESTKKNRFVFPKNGRKKLNEKGKNEMCKMREFVEEIVRNKTESRKTGENVNAHQAYVNRQSDSQTVFRQPKISPAQEHESRRCADRDLDRQKRQNAHVEQSCH